MDIKLEPVEKSELHSHMDTEGENSSFLQSIFWAEFKSLKEWTPYFFSLEADNWKTWVTVLVRKLAGFLSIAYIPMGPAVSVRTAEEQTSLLSQLASLLKPYLPKNTLYVRCDPPWGTSVLNSHISGETKPEELFPEFPGKPVRRAAASVQPPDTVLLNLAKTPETLLSEMKPKWRYNIRLGEKKGVKIKCLEGNEAIDSGIPVFYQLYLETARRDGISIHTEHYYTSLFEYAEKFKTASMAQYGTEFDRDELFLLRVYIAEHENTPIAAIITLFYKKEAVYLYGASSNEKRNLMPAYSLQWRAICDAQSLGCRSYDFYGIPPVEDPAHPMYGLYRFKTGFGGSIIHRIGTFDVPLKPVTYELYRFAEILRTFWYKRVRKLFRR
ncbi:peptidoglycan bridge formation glycyltransferase FemA/FemB family protein [Brucepastera parasyntrophica]|uniref:lipid II:glycine glycyltransferase FemX n=1 Tax=Brucepastera parasyntrophica TaxID=2880008 RepID=UPI00210B5667|nr:peptidoglycan bridge formation glycyltransferase FemA/FemB family protein [Brucepastera parasyntrophica]ULQ60017.1 peptidoglycan bridge formation glycyltransferase FemA/FemB family protein [Brucepastera parasyntrophica]